MALFYECMLKCARKLLDTADIVREAIYQQLSHSYYRTSKHGSESSQEILDSFQRNGVIQAVTLQPIISSAC